MAAMLSWFLPSVLMESMLGWFLSTFSMEVMLGWFLPTFSMEAMLGWFLSPVLGELTLGWLLSTLSMTLISTKVISLLEDPHIHLNSSWNFRLRFALLLSLCISRQSRWWAPQVINFTISIRETRMKFFSFMWIVIHHEKEQSQSDVGLRLSGVGILSVKTSQPQQTADRSISVWRYINHRTIRLTPYISCIRE